MNKEKLENKFGGLLEDIISGKHSEQSELELYAIQIKGQKIHLFGYGDKPVPLLNGIILCDVNNQVEILGCLDQKIYTTGIDENLITIIVDFRNEKNPKFYFNVNGNVNLISSKTTTFHSNDKLYLYWQYGADNFLLTIGYDSMMDDLYMKEIVISSSSYCNQLKLITQHLLDLMLQKKGGVMNNG